MSLFDLLRRHSRASSRESSPDQAIATFAVDWNAAGVTWTLVGTSLQAAAEGSLSSTTEDQYIVLSMLAELDRAEDSDDGFRMTSWQAAVLSDELAVLLGLPSYYRGNLHTQVRGNTTAPNFAVRIRPLRQQHPEPYSRLGAMMTVGHDNYRLTPPLLQALEATERFEGLELDSRFKDVDSVRLVSELQDAVNRSQVFVPYGLSDDDPLAAELEPPQHRLELDLQHLNQFTSFRPDEVRLSIDPQSDGSLRLNPDLGTGHNPEELLSTMRTGSDTDSSTVLRHGNELVVVDPEPMEAVREIRRVRRIPAEHVPDFYCSPSSFIDKSKVNLELHFSVRVRGIGALVPISLAELSSHGLQWTEHIQDVLEPEALVDLAKDDTSLAEMEDAVALAGRSGSTIAVVDKHLIDVSDATRVRHVLQRATELVRAEETSTDDLAEKTVRVGIHLHDADHDERTLLQLAEAVRLSQPVDYSGLARSPYRHQVDGVDWIVGLMEASLDGPIEHERRIQGAILADDMGLGKTLMALTALREFQRMESRAGDPLSPSLIVLPLTLIEDWEAEIDSTFLGRPLADVVVLQADRDLPAFRYRGTSRESKAPLSKLTAGGMLAESEIRFSLAVGDEAGADRLDVPGRVVITTYETLASYQLSLAQVDWGVVIFDEAQRIKNPETLAARAAKALKARFKLVATGTPVENTLRDLWSLMDTAQTGLLGTWGGFRQEWARMIEEGSPEEQLKYGQRLSELIRPFMLRRIKDDHLTDLPTKTVHSGVSGMGLTEDPTLFRTMPEAQASEYRRTMNRHQTLSKTKGGALKTLQSLRTISLHPGAVTATAVSGQVPNSREQDSARITAAIDILDSIRERDEKAIVFVINKWVQLRLAQWIHARYGVQPSIVNGETSALSTRRRASRRDLVQGFQARPGFGVIIMSPLAAGTGLTVTGANHAIHLERHWNPAKEAQATDRIYRIGQTKDVHIYLPMAIYPDDSIPSFDLTLHQLLEQKTDLKDAVLVPEVKQRDAMKSLGLLT